MSTAYESANLLIKLYELRREPTMREARNWFARDFNPSTIDDVMADRQRAPQRRTSAW